MMDPVAAQLSSYTDMKGLNQLRGQPVSEKSIRQAAQQFEALFTQMMLKQMRAATPKGGLFDSDQSQFYQQMFDQQISLSLSESSGMGLSELLVRQLSKGFPDAAADSPDQLAGIQIDQPLSGGGDHEAVSLPETTTVNPNG